uniref:General transcription factor IIH subunit n=1 Tax=Syphacia muris TaxID=451379 RepID=A0A0N5AMW4_9BILA
MINDEEQKGYTWETAYAEGLNIRDVLQEDDTGSVEKSIMHLILEAKKRRRQVDRPIKVRLGIMRYMYIIIDCSSAMAEKAFSSTRLNVTLKALGQFIEKFSEANPISQLGVIVCKDKRTERLIPLTGNVRHIKEAIFSLTELCCRGEFSLQNSLILALKNLPGYASREVVAIIANLSTCDPSNIFSTFEVMLKRNHVQCSVIGLNAEVFVYKKLATTTSGRYDVVLDKPHLEVLLSEYINPPKAGKNFETSVVRMGFPSRQNIVEPTFCLCHQSELRQPLGRGFLCPQCGARYCSLPIECRICRLTLISAPQLARSFLHLLPLAAFKEIDSVSGTNCFGCRRFLDEKCFSCKKCEAVYCLDCDLLLHESLQLCPACFST